MYNLSHKKFTDPANIALNLFSPYQSLKISVPKLATKWRNTAE